jgi:hypothetical protein
VNWLKDTGDAIVRFFDAYSLRARLLPSILGAAPVLAAVLLLISWRTFELSSIVAVLGGLALVYALSDWARKEGKKIEPRIYNEMGGKPSVTIMFRSDDTIDQLSKDRYRSFLAGKINQPEPTAVDELNNRAAVIGFYELAGTWLRENTRETKKFPILFNELVTYGARHEVARATAQPGGRHALRRFTLVSLAGGQHDDAHHGRVCGRRCTCPLLPARRRQGEREGCCEDLCAAAHPVV